MRSSLLFALLCSATFLARVATAPAAEPMRFITHRDGKLYDGDAEFRFVSWNIPNLHCVEDAFDFLGDSPWRWPDEFEIAAALVDKFGSDSLTEMKARFDLFLQMAREQ